MMDRIDRVHGPAPSVQGGQLQQVLDQLLEIAGGHRAVLVAAAVVDEQRAVDHDRAAGETDAAIEALDLVVRLRLHQPVGRAVQHRLGSSRSSSSAPSR